MTPLDARAGALPPSPSPSLANLDAVTRVLARTAAVQALELCLLIAAALLTQAHAGQFPVLDTLLRQGAHGLIGAGLAISLTATLCCTLLIAAKRRAVGRPSPDGAADSKPRRLSVLLRRHRAGQQRRGVPGMSLVGWPQGILLLAGVTLSCWLIYRFQPQPGDDAVVDWSGIASLTLLPAFLLIVCERMVGGLAPESLPDATRLAALIRVPVGVLLAFAALLAARGFGVAIPHEICRLLALPLLALNAELAVRALGPCFLPTPEPEHARAPIGSLLAALLQPKALRGAEITRHLRDRFGIDVSRSWAVGYARVAAPPILLGLLLLAWGLTGITRIGLNERGSYERFGAPTAMLHPGLHVVLPWPFGRVRRFEFGVVHALSIGTSTVNGAASSDVSTADGAPPASANQLWDQQGGADVPYLIAGRSGLRQSFETVSVNLRVMYRVGMDDASAQRALYGDADPEQLIRAYCGRLLARFFADTTLAQVLGERREQIAAELRRELQEALDRRRSGLDVVALVVEAMHPPSGAAIAYRSVQAAEIAASTQRAEESGLAYGTLTEAARDARDAENAARAAAAELLSATEADRTQNDADILAYRSGGQAFALERYFASLRAALANADLEIIDSRMNGGQQPLIDLRAPRAAALNPLIPAGRGGNQ
jgi:regulator of protease activity HflC (stomatin/prohibitin superfamily)